MRSPFPTRKPLLLFLSKNEVFPYTLKTLAMMFYLIILRVYHRKSLFPRDINGFLSMVVGLWFPASIQRNSSLSWNVRGLGRPTKRHLVKDFIFSSRADIVCLQESKLQDLHISTWRSIGGSNLKNFEFLPALGTAGGIIIAWNSS